LPNTRELLDSFFPTEVQLLSFVCSTGGQGQQTSLVKPTKLRSCTVLVYRTSVELPSPVSPNEKECMDEEALGGVLGREDMPGYVALGRGVVGVVCIAGGSRGFQS